MHRGYIKLWRKFEDWEWFTNPNMAHFFVWLLIRATHEDEKFMGHDIKRGQLVFGRCNASRITGLSEQTIRTCLNHLNLTNEVTIYPTNKFSIITIVNYNSYQCGYGEINQNVNQKSNQQLTNNQPATNHIQTHKHNKNIRTLYSVIFEKLWTEYPRKEAKGYAYKAFIKISPSEELLEEMLSSVRRAKNSLKWKEKNGQFIPHLATWLNGRRWEDIITETVQSKTPFGLSEAERIKEKERLASPPPPEFKKLLENVGKTL